MKWFRKLFKKKKKSYPQDNKFKLCIIDEKSDLIHEVLGITEERCRQLTELCIKAYDTSDIKTESYAMVVDQCVHVNEVVMAVQIFEKISHAHAKKRSLRSLMDNLFGDE
jgi:hypothetical protein